MNRNPDAAFAARTFADFAMSGSPDDIAFEVTRKLHPTEQQRVMVMFMACIKTWAQFAKDNMKDGRCDATLQVSKKIVEEVGEEPHLPFI